MEGYNIMGSITTSASPPLLPVDQQAVLAAINATEAPVPSDMLHSLFTAQAMRQPKQVAVVASGRSFTYAEIYRRARHLGEQLRQQGASPNSLVAIVMEHGWEQVVAVLGTLYAGAAYLPIDPQLPAERLQQLLAYAQVTTVLTQSWLNATLNWPADIHRIALDTDTASTEFDAAFEPLQTLDDLAYVILSSDSTKDPLGVMISQRSSVNTIVDINQRFAVQPSDKLLALTPLSCDRAAYDIFGTLLAGGSIVFPAATALRDPAHWLALLAEEQVTILNTAPALMTLLLAHVQSQAAQLPATLRLLLLSADWIPLQLPDQIRAAAAGPVQIVSLGGASETSGWSMVHVIESVAPDSKRIPYGRPLANQRVYVLNDALRMCPLWVTGRLYFGGLGLAKGYWRNEEQSSERFVTHPRTGERLYRSGDMGRYVPDGTIELIGNAHTQISLNGIPVDLREIEVLLAQHPQVQAAAVVPTADAQKLVAFVVPGAGQNVSPDELRSFLRGKISDYVLPAQFMTLASLPLTASGSVDRQALQTVDLPALPAAPAASSPAKPTPEVDITAQFVRLVAGVLGIDTVDPDMNLFDVGAQSVELIQILLQAEQEFGLRMDVEELLRFPYVNTLVRHYKAQQQTVTETPPTPTFVAAAEAAAEPAPTTGDLIVDPVEREAFKKRQLGLRHDLLDKPYLQLALPASQQQQLAAIQQRSSHRQFGIQPVTIESFSHLLSALRQITLNNQPKYWYASAGGLYPVQTYLHIKEGRVQGVTAGTYYYHPVEHRLVTIASGVEIDRSAHGWINRSIFDQSAFSIFFIGQLDAISPIYGKLARDFCMYEAGSMGQLLMMVAPESHIGLCGIGEMEFDQVRHLFALQQRQVFLHALLGGPLPGNLQMPRPAAQPTQANNPEGLSRVLRGVKKLSVDRLRKRLTGEEGE